MLLDHVHNKRHFLTVVVEFHIMKLKVEDVPLPTVDRLVANSIFCFPLGNPRRTAVRLETLLVAQGKQLVTDLLIVVLEMLQPRKLLTSPLLKNDYHQGWALSPGIISGHPFWSGEAGGIQVWLILASNQGLMCQTLRLDLSAICVLMKLVAAALWSPLRKQSWQKPLSLSLKRFSISSSYACQVYCCI